MRINEITLSSGIKSKVTIKQLLNRYFITSGKIDINLEDQTVSCSGTVQLDRSSNSGVTKLPVKFNYIRGNFLVLYSNITSLEGCPLIVGGDFHCSYTKITSLEYGPQQVEGDYYCHNNSLTTLSGIPTVIGGTVLLSYSPSLPLMRALVAKNIQFNKSNTLTDNIAEIMNKYAGQGKSAMMKCSSEILTLGKELGVDLRQNARW